MVTVTPPAPGQPRPGPPGVMGPWASGRATPSRMRAGLVSEAEADTHWHAAPRRYDESPASRRYARPTVGSIMIQLEVVKLKISQPDGLLVSVEPAGASPAGGPKRSMTTGAGAADSGRPAPSGPSQ